VGTGSSNSFYPQTRKTLFLIFARGEVIYRHREKELRKEKERRRRLLSPILPNEAVR